MSASHLPKGHHAVAPYLVVPGVARLVEFLKASFGAELAAPMATRPDGSVMHADVTIGGSHVMMGEPSGSFSPMPAMVHLYVPDVDAAYAAAIAAGAESVTEPSLQTYGDRSGGVKDASGNIWWLATHVEDVPAEDENIAGRAAG